MPALEPLLHLARAVTQADTLDELFSAALQSLRDTLAVDRASILLFDSEGVMRFKAWRGLTEEYRTAVEGHSPWRPGTPDAEPILVPNVREEPSLHGYLDVLAREGIAALAFVPLVSRRGIIGKFMLYYGTPHVFSPDEVIVAATIAHQIGFAVERIHTEAEIRHNAERLRFALDAANMGTWEWELATNEVRWSDNLERVHGLPPGTFNGRFESYEREIHPEDRQRVFESIGRAVREGLPHHVEYRIIGPDGSVRWVEGDGRVECDPNGQPIRMSGVCMNITARKHAELENVRLYEEAQEANRIKDEFLSTLSHELRTPLSTILGWTHLLETGMVSPEKVAGALAAIHRNAKVQARLIEDILDVSRIDSGKLALTLQPVQLSDVLKSELDAVQPLIQRQQLELHADIAAAAEATVSADPPRLRQIISHLLSNAIKFTDPGGRVLVRAAVGPASCELTVEDSGIGISPSFLPHVFDRFRQADGTTTRTRGGLGLGLSITRELVQLHGGTIEARSEGAGHGATFVVCLPLAAGTAARGPEPETGISSTSDALISVRILVVDDDDDTRQLVGTLLESCGASVRQAKSVRDAWQLLQAERFDLVLADIAMPEADGYTLVDAIRHAGDPLKRLRIVALTAHARTADRERAYAAGFNAFQPKPIDPPALLQTVRDLLAVPASARA